MTEEKPSSPEKTEKKEPACVDLTLSDSEDEAPPPPKKRLAAAASGKWQSTAVGDTKIKLSRESVGRGACHASSVLWRWEHDVMIGIPLPHRRFSSLLDDGGM